MDQFISLTWNDLTDWAGSRIVSRGRSYQKQGRVSDLAVTDDDALIAWVDGSKQYATRVTIDKDGLPESICSCPYAINCKHGVAVLLEYLKQIEDSRQVPKASKNDERLALFEDDDWSDNKDDEGENAVSEYMQKNIDAFLRGKTKVQLMGLIHDLAEQYPQIAQDLVDRRQMTSGNTKTLVTRLRLEIRQIGDEPGWQDYWQGDGYTPDYSSIRAKLEAMLKEGYPDEVLSLGEELINTGTRQVEVSHDDGETEMEVAGCMPVVVRALDQSSLAPADKLAWAVDAVLKDQYEICAAFAEYLYKNHPKTDWYALSDRLLAQLMALEPAGEADDFNRDYARDRLSNWVIHALEQAGRKEKILPLCETEAQITGSYDRLVKRLMEAHRYQDAEHWIREGIRSIGGKWPGVASNLRNKLREIRSRQKNWPAVAALQTEEFVRHPGCDSLTKCRKAARKVKVWPEVRAYLLDYLESGRLPWEQKDWPLPASGPDVPKRDRKELFPMIDDLIDIAIYEKKPDQVLRWYDQRPRDRFGWDGFDENKIATAIQSYAADRAVDIWRNSAERLIAQVKPRAYAEAAKYLRKAAKVMTREKKQTEWDRYMQGLREKHIRKRRLIEILDGLDDKPIVKRKH